MASTIANMVKILILYPNTDNTAKVPKMTTGTAKVGMIVARQFCKNKNITKKTSTTASNSVYTTCVIDSRTNGVVS